MTHSHTFADADVKYLVTIDQFSGMVCRSPFTLKHTKRFISSRPAAAEPNAGRSPAWYWLDELVDWWENTIGLRVVKKTPPDGAITVDI